MIACEIWFLFRYSFIRHTHITKKIKKTIITKQIEIKNVITTKNEKLIMLKNKFEELNISNDDQKAIESTKSKIETLQQLEKKRKTLSASRKIFDELLFKSKKKAIAKIAAENQNHSIIMTFDNQNSNFQIESINDSISEINFEKKWMSL